MPSGDLRLACRSSSNTSHFLSRDLVQATVWCWVMFGAFQPSVAGDGSAFPWLGITYGLSLALGRKICDYSNLK